MAKRETILKTVIRADGSVIASVPGFPDILADGMRMPRNIQLQAMAYGIREKMTNAAALGRDPKTGAHASPAQKRDAVIRILDNMMAGNWELRAMGSSDDALLLDAIVEAMGAERESVREAMDGWSTEQRRAMQADDAIAPVFERMKKEAATRAASGTDTKALLAGLTK